MLLAVALALMGTVYVSAQTATHEPGIYETTYGQTLKSFGDRDYEVYVMNDAKTLRAGLNASGYSLGNGLDIDAGWVIVHAQGNNSSGITISGSANQFTGIAAQQLNMRASNSSKITFKVKGYDEFAFVGKDNSANGADATKNFAVTVNDVAQPMTLSSSFTIRPFALDPSIESTIVVYIGGSGGSSNNVFSAFSLRLSDVPKSPTITTDPTSLAFGEVAENATASKTINVKGAALEGDLTVASDNAAFSCAAAIAQGDAQAEAGYDLIVTFDPTGLGLSDPTGNITISGGGLESDIVIPVSATVIAADVEKPTILSISPDPAEKLPLSGEIVLTFSENVKLGAGAKISFQGGEALTPQIDGSVVTVPYSGLTPNTNYVFRLEVGDAGQDGAFEDESGNKLDYFERAYISETPAPVITLTSVAGTDAQAKKAGTAITNIVYNIENVQDADNAVEVTFAGGNTDGLTGIYDKATGTLTISGTLAEQATYPTILNYTVTTTALIGYEDAAISASGTLTVKDPNAMEVALLYNAAAAPAGAGKIFPMLDANYNVTVINITDPNTTAQMEGIIAANYDLIILHEAVPSQNNQTTAVGVMGSYIGQVPILNMKSHQYGKANSAWPAGAGQNNDGELDKVSVLINSGFENHQIFTGVTITDGNRVTMANANGVIRYATGVQNVNNIAINGSGDAGNVAILEDISGVEKYMMIALSAAAENFTDDGLLVIKNACDYLMGIAAAKNTEAKITEFFIGETEGTIDEDAKTIEVMLPFGTDIVNPLAVTLEASLNATITADGLEFKNGAYVDFSDGEVIFSVQAEDETVPAVDYTVTVSVATTVAPEITGDENKDQDVLIGETIENIALVATDYANIEFVYGEAGTEADFETATGLTVEIAEGTVTISGTIAATADVGDYAYTVTATGNDATVQDAVVNGTITVALGTPVANEVTTVTETTAELSWSEVAGADSYTVEVTTLEQLGETQWTTPQTINNNNRSNVENLDLTPANGPYIIEFELAASNDFSDILGFTPSGSAPGGTNAGARITIGTNDNKFVADNTFRGGRIIPILNPSLTLDGSFSKYQLLLEGAVAVDNDNATVIDESSFIQFRNQSAGAGSFIVQNVKVLKLKTVITQSVDKAETIFTAEDLTAGTEYTYTVTAVKNTTSNKSNEVNFTTAVPVDKSALEAAIIEAQSKNEADYTPESWINAGLAAVIATAQDVYNDVDATQPEVNAQVTAIENAISALVPVAPVLDYTDLETAIGEGNSELTTKTEADYIPETWQMLEDMVVAGEALVGNATTQQEIADAAKAIRDAIDGLTLVGDEIDYDALEALIAEIEAEQLLASEHTPESWQVLEDALEAGKTLLANRNAPHHDQILVDNTKEAIDIARAALERATTGIDETGVSVKVLGLTGAISIEGVAEGTTVTIATVNGQLIYKGAALSSIPAPAGVAIVIINEKAVKVLVK